MLMNMAATWDSLAADLQKRIDTAAGSIPVERLNASNDE
jgi:hypothetical protein